MNYRHAYHAGNFADCYKHALYISLADAFAQKPAPYFVLDTHAGAGRYDLSAETARRTGEADIGINRLIGTRPPPLRRYLGLVDALGMYPGSPALIKGVLRPQDRLACCEIHPEDGAALRRLFLHDPQVEVHNRSGWEAIGALLPPKETRGLVLIDPPYEDPDEFATLARNLIRGYARFGHGVFAAWYPIKQRAAVRTFHATLKMSGIRDIVATELYLRQPTAADRLNGCGLLVINPPFQFEDKSRVIGEAVLQGMGGADEGAGTAVIRIADE